jgi:hypothetical protein
MLVTLEHYPLRRYLRSHGQINQVIWHNGVDQLILTGGHGIYPGSSGGAVLDGDQLVGIITAYGLATGYGYAVGPHAIRRFLGLGAQ